ncbi:MAG: transposase [Muribaculaceae bacterium]|nr:transposase [Muribaculaceae bacterium]
MARHNELEVVPSMKRRKEDHDYNARCVYLITLCVNGRKPLFGTLRDADAEHPYPWVEPSELGMKVIENRSNIMIENPEVKTLGFQLMPEHVHGIIFVSEQLSRHLGHVIARFKAKCTASFRSQLECSEAESQKIALWEQGHNDRILYGKGQLETWVNYLRDNPRRSWVKRHHKELFNVRHGITVGANQVSVMGNHFLLDYPFKVAVKCSRSMTDKEIEETCDQFLSKAKDGAVLVSPCISRGEKVVMRRVFDAGFPLIILLENGFAPKQKPSGRQFDACAEGRLLLVAPWEHHNQRRAITREQCMALNRIAEDIVLYETERD